MADGLPESEVPEWALGQATSRLADTAGEAEILDLARRIAAAVERERHDEWDDPDEGGEA